MNKTLQIEERRREWLRLLKKTMQAIYGRESHYSSLCPQVRIDAEERTKALREVAALSKQIEMTVCQMDEIGRDGGFGFSVLMGSTPDLLTAEVLVLLVAAHLDSNVSLNLRGVQDLIHYVADLDPVSALKVRCMFRSDGILYPFVSMSKGMIISDTTVFLKESGFNSVMGLSNEILTFRCDAEALVGRVR